MLIEKRKRKKNLDIVFITTQLKCVTQELSLPIPNEFSMQEENDAQSQWQKGDEKSRCTILGSLNNVLKQQHMNIVTTYEILLSLDV